jgi:hypothetical protein
MINYLYSYHQESFLISVCYWERWFRKGVAGGKEKRERIIRNERNVKSKSNVKKEC